MTVIPALHLLSDSVDQRGRSPSCGGQGLMLQCFWVPGERLLPTVENEEVSLAHALLDHCHIAALSRCKLESEVVQQVSQPVMEAE